MESKSTTIDHYLDQGEVNIIAVFRLKLGFIFLNLFMFLEYFYLVNLLIIRG